MPSNREPGTKVIPYSSPDTAKPGWRATMKRAGIKTPSYHACRAGVATAMMQARIDPTTDAKHVFTTYGHAMSDETLADRITGTPETQWVAGFAGQSDKKIVISNG